MLAGWRSLALQVTTQAQVRTEVVWFKRMFGRPLQKRLPQGLAGGRTHGSPDP